MTTQNNTDRDEQQAVVPPERIWVEPFREGYPVPIEFYAHPIAHGIEYVRASIAAVEGDGPLLSSEVAWKIALHIKGKNSDYFNMREGLAELEGIISRNFANAALTRTAATSSPAEPAQPIDTPVVAREFINEFTQAAINAHIGFKHEMRWRDCDYASCAKWREMIDTFNAATAAPSSETPVPEWSVEHPDRERQYWATLGTDDAPVPPAGDDEGEADARLRLESIAEPWICTEEKPCEEAVSVHWDEMITALVAANRGRK